MRKPLLATKFYIPPRRPELVSRPRLVERLNQGLAGKLTLISAPAGFGKTTLLSEWAQQCSQQGTPLGVLKIAWLSLDNGDNDPHRFLAYFITALGKSNPGIGEAMPNSLESSQSLEIEGILTRLVNEIADLAQPIVLVLDDYHVITEPEIQEILLFVLENLPVRMHLVISSRSDPPWPLARFRVRAELTEIRVQELRFTLEEAAAFLNNMVGLALSPEDIAALEARTEGWIAGLQMAALSMQNRQDKTGFIKAFRGSNRFVMDYLVEEVLNQQAPEYREFLLKTSILERLTAPLCDAIVGGQNSQSVLLDLEQKNMFLISLDDQRRWYRYHHLFGDLLRNHLQQTHADQVVDLHKKASIWSERNDLLSDAIQHALAANEIEQIVHLIEEFAIYTMDSRELRVLIAWLDGLPETIFHKNPWLLVARTLGYFRTGKYELTETSLSELESILPARPKSDKMGIRIRGHIAAIHSYLAELRDDPLSAIQQAENALALLPEKDIKLRSYVSIRWANCLMWLGDLKKAILAYKETGEASKQIGDGLSAIIAHSEMAIVQMFAGNLRQAIISIQDTCNYAEELTLRDGRRHPAMGVLYRHMSHIKRELNDLSEADYYANEAVKICQQWGEKEALAFGLLAVARVKFAQREYLQLEDLFQQILQIGGQISPKAFDQFRFWALHFQLLQGKVENAEIWASERGLTPNDKFDYPGRFEYHNFAHLLAAKGNYSQAIKIIDTLVNVAINVGDEFFAIQYLTLQAIILKKMNKPDEAMTSMEKALSLARPEGYMRSILDEGEAIGGLLRMAIAKGIEVEYASKLLTALGEETKLKPLRSHLDAGIVEPLSEREMEVLRLLVTDLTTPEIADELIVSVSTVRTHIKNIYAKLDVHSRLKAVTKARELNLL